MALATRLNFALLGLIAAGLVSLAWFDIGRIEMPNLLAGGAIVGGVAALTVVLVRMLDQTTAELRSNKGALARETDQRRRAQAALGEISQRANLFLEAVASADYPVIGETLDGTITAWNPGAERLYGFATVEALGRNIRIIVPLDRLHEQSEMVARAVNGDPVENFETIRVTREGRRLDVAVSLRLSKGYSGEITGLTKITRDITAQKFAEEKFRLAVESCPSGMMMVDDGGKIIMVNTEIERLFGYSREELMGKPVEILVPERLRGRHIRHRVGFTNHPEARRTGGGRDLFGRRQDGTEFPVEIALNPIQTREGVLILSVIVDITERKQAEEMFRLAVEACPSGMVMIDKGGKVVMVNTEIEQLFGYRRDELIGQPMSLLLPERLRHLQIWHRNIQTWRAQGFAAEREGRHTIDERDLFGLRKDGTEFPLEVGHSPIQVGDELLVLSVIVDISERKRMERLKDEFVSTVSHELRTPLTSIAGSLGLLIGNVAGNLPDSAMRLLTIAHTNSQRLVRLINDILDIEKMESGQVVFNFKRVDIRSLVEHTIEANRGFADGYKVKIRLDATAPGGEVHADPDRLAQVITNLLSNAIKFSPPDSEVVVTIEERGGMARVSVRDHGPGIPDDFKPHIFEKFAQADASDTRQKGGTGLGLSIAKQIVARLRGTISFADAPDGGAIFHVDLPGWSQIARRGIHDVAGQDRARILLCEDDPDAALALREGLLPFGFRTDFAHGRDEAISHATTHVYAAIIVDLELPDGNGINLIRQLRAQPSLYKTPIVVISGTGTTTDQLASLELEVLGCLEKPIEINRLAQMLDHKVVGGINGRPLILHVDDDREVLKAVAATLGSTATVVSVDTLEDARRALAAHRFDLAVLDISLGRVSGLDLLPDLRGPKGNAIPVIVFSARDATTEYDPQVEASLNKSQASLERLVATVRDRLKLRSSNPQEVA